VASGGRDGRCVHVGLVVVVVVAGEGERGELGRGNRERGRSVGSAGVGICCVGRPEGGGEMLGDVDELRGRQGRGVGARCGEGGGGAAGRGMAGHRTAGPEQANAQAWSVRKASAPALSAPTRDLHKQ
jgi:hypothetical protein